MKRLLKSASRLGRVLARDREKLLLGLGAIALAGFVRVLRQRWLLQRLAELEAESEEARRREKSFGNGKRFRAKKTMDRTSSLSRKNLMGH